MCQPDCDKQGAAQRQENIRKLRAIREGVRVRARWEEEGLAAYQSDVLQRIQSLKADIAEHEKTRSEHQGSFAPTPPRLDRRSISSTRMRACAVSYRVVLCVNAAIIDSMEALYSEADKVMHPEVRERLLQRELASTDMPLTAADVPPPAARLAFHST